MATTNLDFLKKTAIAGAFSATVAATGKARHFNYDALKNFDVQHPLVKSENLSAADNVSKWNTFKAGKGDYKFITKKAAALDPREIKAELRLQYFDEFSKKITTQMMPGHSEFSIMTNGNTKVLFPASGKSVILSTPEATNYSYRNIFSEVEPYAFRRYILADKNNPANDFKAEAKRTLITYEDGEEHVFDIKRNEREIYATFGDPSHTKVIIHPDDFYSKEHVTAELRDPYLAAEDKKIFSNWQHSNLKVYVEKSSNVDSKISAPVLSEDVPKLIRFAKRANIYNGMAKTLKTAGVLATAAYLGYSVYQDMNAAKTSPEKRWGKNTSLALFNLAAAAPFAVKGKFVQSLVAGALAGIASGFAGEYVWDRFIEKKQPA